MITYLLCMKIYLIFHLRANPTLKPTRFRYSPAVGLAPR